MLALDSATRAGGSSYRFGPFRLRPFDRILERDGERIAVTPKVIDTLFVLVENSGQVVTKDDLMKAVWPDVTVVESGLTRNISVLRKALEEDCEGSYIETIPHRGYRFVAPVAREDAAAGEPDTETTPAPAPEVRRAPGVGPLSWRLFWPASTGI
jgi:DNA-binding winged helix-turn-helix (wHTH) protein